MTFSLHEAKAKLSELVSLAETGETIEITRYGKVVAQLIGANFEPRQSGRGHGSFQIVGDWDFTDDEVDELFYDPPLEPTPPPVESSP